MSQQYSRSLSLLKRSSTSNAGTSHRTQPFHSLVNISVASLRTAGTVYVTQGNTNQEDTMSKTLVVNPVARTTNVVRYLSKSQPQPQPQHGTIIVHGQR
jgi:hypothetical protein